MEYLNLQTDFNKIQPALPIVFNKMTPGRQEIFNNCSPGLQKKFWVLDLFGGEGLAALGYLQQGFNVIGCDIEEKKYPGYFVKMDWREALYRFGDKVHAVHASPPCQIHSKLKGLCKNEYKSYIKLCHRKLIKTGLPFVIENVPMAMENPNLKLTGAMFGLPLFRERWFWSNFDIYQPNWVKCRGSKYANITGHSFNLEDAKKAFGTDANSTIRGFAEGIPPVYTRHIASELKYLLTKKALNKTRAFFILLICRLKAVRCFRYALFYLELKRSLNG